MCGNYFAGKSRARDAALNAIQSPLLDIGIERATGIVWNITGGNDLTLYEVFSLPLCSCMIDVEFHFM
jgi:cell division GTPase FtsZ